MSPHTLLLAFKTAFKAGEAILPIYNDEHNVTFKQDESPLTAADTRSNDVIKEHLGTEYPILSEEGKQTEYAERSAWQTFWLIDPLDGTKEFIKKNGEFTVNIALIKQGAPALGVVYVPVTRKMYFGMEDYGSFACTIPENATDEMLEKAMNAAQRLDENTLPDTYTIVASRSHMSPETESFIAERKEKHGDIDMISSGSSIKLCLVAEGKAHVYPRLAPTMEWDTAAAQGVARFAGCRVYNYETGKDLEYNKENLLNPWFVVERGEGSIK